MSPRIRRALLAVSLALGAAPARTQDEPTRAPARPRRTPAAATASVRPLTAPPRPRELASAPGRIAPAAPVPARPEAPPIALRGGTLHPLVGPAIAGGTLVIEEGRIRALGTGVAIPPAAHVFDVTGLHVYPGLIAADTVLGLVEIGAVRATRDLNEVGDVNPNVRAEVGVNPDSLLLPVTRSNGILVAVSAPRGGLLSGTGAVLELDGWTWADMTLRAPAGLWMNWPRMAIDRSGSDAKAIDKREKARDEKLRQLRETFATARAYAAGRDAAAAGGPALDRDVKWDAMVPVIRGTVPVVVHAATILEIKAALAFAAEERLRLIIEGGDDAPRVADELARRKVPVLVGNVYPVGRDWEPYDVQFTTPLRLYEAGVEFAIIPSPDGDESANVRNLPYVAAKAVAYGLPHDEGLKAITLYPARIFGVGDRLGSLEPGKDGTVIVTDGDPLEVRSNVHRAFIRGREVDLSDRHKQLYERFRLKPRRSPATP